MTPPEVICLGETMTLVTPVTPTPLATSEVFKLEAGGAETNVAIQLQQLGHRTSWVSRVGTDPLGDRLVAAVSSHGVDVSSIQRDSQAQTGVYFKDPGDGSTNVYYYRSGSAASRMSPETIRGLRLDTAKIMHVTGITPGLSQSCRQMMDALISTVDRSKTLLSFDVNYRPGVWETESAAPVLRRLAAQADIVFVGRDEAELLWNTTTNEEIRALLPEPKHLIIKDGPIGATELSQETVVFVPAHDVEVVEVVGAGDAFAAGYLSAFLQGGNSSSCLLKGHESAARVLSSTADFLPAELPATTV